MSESNGVWVEWRGGSSNKGMGWGTDSVLGLGIGDRESGTFLLTHTQAPEILAGLNGCNDYGVRNDGVDLDK